MKYILAAAAVVATTFAQNSAPKCDENNLCPQSAPCCSQYGQCGVGAYCLGGCDPKSSFSLQSCMAAPVCKSGDFKMDSLDDVAANTVYLGDASKGVNWVSSGKPVTYNGDSLLLTMAPSTVGTLLTSTHYVWYGKISATMTSSQGQGVVTAFILMSDVKDEIDFEFVGDNVDSAQSNYYYQGITDYHNMVPLSTSDTRVNVHTYTIDWSPDSVIWSIDGEEMRTLKKSDTWNDTSKSYHFPQTPSRIQLSLWPAGLPTNGNGTIEWAGGLVNWDTSPYMQNGYYYAMVNDINVECYDPPSGFSNNFGSNAYYYTSRLGTDDTVAIGNNDTVLASFMATGDSPDTNPNAKPSGSQSASSASSSAADMPESVPGISGGGNAATSDVNPATGEGGGSGSTGDSGSSGTSDSSTSGSGSNSGSGFSQGGGSSGGSSSDAPKIVAGSAVALLGFFIAALML